MWSFEEKCRWIDSRWNRFCWGYMCLMKSTIQEIWTGRIWLYLIYLVDIPEYCWSRIILFKNRLTLSSVDRLSRSCKICWADCFKSLKWKEFSFSKINMFNTWIVVCILIIVVFGHWKIFPVNDFDEIMLQDHHRDDIIFVLIINFLREEENDYRLKPILYVQQVNEDPFKKNKEQRHSIHII